MRSGRKVRQEMVARLGELDAQGRADALALARQITGRAEQYEMFEVRAATPAKVEVRLDRVRIERARKLDVPADQVNDDRLYHALDRLLPHKAAIEQHLGQQHAQE